MAKSKRVARYAFWQYDMYPYCLWGKIKGAGKGGSFQMTTYDGYWFKPFLIVDGAKGKRLGEKLDALRAEYRWQSAVLDLEFDDRLKAILPQAPTFRNNPLGNKSRREVRRARDRLAKGAK